MLFGCKNSANNSFTDFQQQCLHRSALRFPQREIFDEFLHSRRQMRLLFHRQNDWTVIRLLQGAHLDPIRDALQKSDPAEC